MPDLCNENEVLDGFVEGSAAESVYIGIPVGPTRHALLHKDCTLLDSYSGIGRIIWVQFEKRAWRDFWSGHCEWCNMWSWIYVDREHGRWCVYIRLGAHSWAPHFSTIVARLVPTEYSFVVTSQSIQVHAFRRGLNLLVTELQLDRYATSSKFSPLNFYYLIIFR